MISMRYDVLVWGQGMSSLPDPILVAVRKVQSIYLEHIAKNTQPPEELLMKDTAAQTKVRPRMVIPTLIEKISMLILYDVV